MILYTYGYNTMKYAHIFVFFVVLLHSTQTSLRTELSRILNEREVIGLEWAVAWEATTTFRFKSVTKNHQTKTIAVMVAHAAR